MASLAAPGEAVASDINEGYGSRGYRAYVLGSLLLVYIFNFIDRAILAVLNDPIKISLGLEDWHMGMIGGTAFALFYVTLGIPIARISETRSRKWIILAALTLWSLMTVFCGFATSFLMLFLLRVGVGIGEAGCTPPAQSMIADYFKPSSRATAVSIYALGVPLGAMFAGVAGGPINDYVTGQNVYNLMASMGLEGLADSLNVVALEGWRIAFAAVGLPGLLLGFVLIFTLKEPPRGYTDPVSAQNKETAKLAEVLRILKSKPAYIHVVLGAAIASFVGYGIGHFVTAFLRRVHGLSLTEAAIYYSLVMGLFAAIGVFSSGWISDRISKRHPNALSWLPALGMSVSVPLYVIGFLVPELFIALIPLCAAALLHYFYLGPMYAVFGGVVDSRMRATSVAVALFVVNLVGLALGPPASGILSTTLKGLMLSTSDLGLSLEVCTAAVNLTEAQAAMCERTDAKGLQYAIVIFACLYLWASVHYLLAGRTLQRDMLSMPGKKD